MLMTRPRPRYNRHRNRTGTQLYIGSGPAFTTPTQIAGLIGWYDFSDGTKVTTSGSNITAVTDKSTTAANLGDGGGHQQVAVRRRHAERTQRRVEQCCRECVPEDGIQRRVLGIVLHHFHRGDDDGCSRSASKSIVGGQFTTTGAFATFHNNGTARFQTFENGKRGANSGGGCINNTWNVLEMDAANGSRPDCTLRVDTGSGAGMACTHSRRHHHRGSGTDTILGAVGEVIIWHNLRLSTTDRNKCRTAQS